MLKCPSVSPGVSAGVTAGQIASPAKWLLRWRGMDRWPSECSPAIAVIQRMCHYAQVLFLFFFFFYNNEPLATFFWSRRFEIIVIIDHFCQMNCLSLKGEMRGWGCRNATRCSSEDCHMNAVRLQQGSIQN